MYGRENGGQLFEQTVTYVGRKILDYWGEETLNTAECFQMYLDYLEIVAPSQYQNALVEFSGKSDDYISEFIGSMIIDGCINVCVNPMSENMTIDKVAQLYEKFPWIEQEHVMVPLADSNGNIKYVPSRRPVVAGEIYYYRLKQYAKEKFSVTSLSATNIRNENSRNKASKEYKALYPRTPIRFGDMEIGNLSHLGPEIVIQMLMLYATSPLARQLYEQLMTGDPFEIDINLDDTSSNRNAEIASVYLKAVGRRIVFIKHPKDVKTPVEISPIHYLPPQEYQPVVFFEPGQTVDPIFLKWQNGDKSYQPIKFFPVVFLKPNEEVDEFIAKNREELKKAAEEADRLEKLQQTEKESQ